MAPRGHPVEKMRPSRSPLIDRIMRPILPAHFCLAPQIEMRRRDPPVRAHSALMFLQSAGANQYLGQDTKIWGFSQWEKFCRTRQMLFFPAHPAGYLEKWFQILRRAEFYLHAGRDSTTMMFFFALGEFSGREMFGEPGLARRTCLRRGRKPARVSSSWPGGSHGVARVLRQPESRAAPPP